MLSFNGHKDIEQYVDEHNIQFISFYLIDIDGRLRNVTIPSNYFSEKVLLNGIGFDASNLGFANVDSSDMILKPDLNFAFEDPIEPERKTLSFFCNVFDVQTGKPFNQDLRHMIHKALSVLEQEGIADQVRYGIELEFNVIDELYSKITPREVSFKIRSQEIASPESGEEIYRLAGNRGYFRAEPNDHLFDLRNEIVAALRVLDIPVKYHHHEVASSQSEIEFTFMPVELAADAAVLAKNISHRVGRKHGMIVTFLPKIISGQAGNGMHVHQFLLKKGKNIFQDPKGLYELSETALYYLGGILKHASSLLAFTNPTTNSYRRLVPGLEAPVKAVFAKANRSAAIRIPAYVTDPEERRFEFRTIDATCNPYLAFAAMIMAGIDGIRNKIDPVKEGFGPLEKNLYDLSEQELAKIQSFPASLEEALNSLEKENEYLVYRNVFAKDLIQKWIEVKRKDIEEMRRIPHPWEVARYYDI
ncbi:MAG: type I glutamate--ammonia ligase [Calditrichaeota bacterium]|nr:type I glutamate--ammonia ligase [Calditrichota bacterium]